MQENKEVLVSHIAESDKSNPKYDGGYKAELSNKTEFLHFLKKYVGAKWADGLTEDNVELCDKEFILEDFLRREADLLYRIHLKGKDIYVYLIMELQSGIDFTMPLRILTYIFSLMLKIFLAEKVEVRERKDYRLPVVIPIVFYNGTAKWSAATKFREYQYGHEVFGNYIIDFKYYLVDLSRIKEEYILNTNSLIDNILAIDKTRNDMDRFSQMLAQMEERMSYLSPQDKVSFSKWLEYVVLAVTEGENREKVHLLIEQLKGGEQGMMHGIQMLILAEKDAARQEGEQEGLREGLQVGTRTREIDFAAKNIKKALRKGLSRDQVCEWVDLEPTDFERMYDALEADPEMSNDALFVLLSDRSQSL